jgi:GNAT superfamily N-acetyltransferase
MQTTPTLRSATLANAKALRELSTQMGYAEVAAPIFEQRLRHILTDTCGAVLIAEMDRTTIGYIHVYAAPLLSTPSDHPRGGYCEIGALVVDQGHRRAGVGRALISTAQAWAQSQGHARLRLYAGVQRSDDAHHFYRALGFESKAGVGFTLKF